MKKIAVLALVGCATLAMSSMAVAQNTQRFLQQRSSNNGNNSEIESLMRYEADEEARASLMQDPQAMRTNWDTARRFAKCANSLNRARSERLLKQDMPSLGESRLDLPKFLDRMKNCAPTNISIDPAFMRGALAEDILTDENSAPEIPPGADSAALTKFISSIAISGSKTGNFAKAQMAAECRTAINPIAVRGLLATEVGSVLEESAFTALNAATSTCDQLKAENDMPLYFQRAYLAQALYHWTNFEA